MQDDLQQISPGRRLCFLVIISCLYFFSCAQSTADRREREYQPAFPGEAVSFLGDTLTRPADDPVIHHHKDSMLLQAWEAYAADSNDLDNIIWLGRRFAYLHRYREAIDVFSRGIALHPASPELYRHRGHRYITIRKPDLAIMDLEQGILLASHLPRASEPDGIPNKLLIPLSNLHFNLFYHLGLAHYIKGDFARASITFQDGMKHADNNDLMVAATDWLYLSSMRQGDTAFAHSLLENIHGDMEIIENNIYLTRLLIYKGEVIPGIVYDTISDLTDYTSLYYALSCHEEFNGRLLESSRLRKEIINSGFWPSFSFIAAEADSSRMKRY